MVGITVSLGIIALHGVSAEDLTGPNFLDKNAVDSVESTLSLQQLTPQLKEFFGSSTGPYLTGTVVTNRQQSIKSFHSDSLYDQFASVFEGPAEYNAVMPNGMRMVVRFQPHLAQLKAVVILDSGGTNVVAAALTYFDRPSGGYHIKISDGSTLTLAANPFVSLVLFYKTPVIDPAIKEATVRYFRRWLAEGNDSSNPEANRMKISVQRI
jgi:hypothetical protein